MCIKSGVAAQASHKIQDGKIEFARTFSIHAYIISKFVISKTPFYDGHPNTVTGCFYSAPPRYL